MWMGYMNDIIEILTSWMSRHYFTPHINALPFAVINIKLMSCIFSYFRTCPWIYEVGKTLHTAFSI